MNAAARKLMIGLSPRLMRNLPVQYGFRNKTLQYLEQSMAHWVLSAGALVAMIPTVDPDGDVQRATLSVREYARSFDGLILQGGADIDPVAYGEQPSELLQTTDPVRDRFELSLLRAFIDAGKPVLGVCRGMQLINVAYGGSLYQDLVAAGATANQHYLPERYDEHVHRLRVEPGGWLAALYPAQDEVRVNSIHHQGVRRLGDGLAVEAWSEDGIPECIRVREAAFVVGVQWHPEFHDARFPELMPGRPLLEAFLAVAQDRRERGD
ncbi:gamma-glutamyl-gamma-aminobutyrate hydrolase family protein [Lysobacter silvisoli]|uniref:Gamma-glutamyl-gamma-aminobutyrate hydrolase family protein n=1 Tax=Lysobacter silvisoli TaxID=2293254 RepID=A0A371K2Q2_9GAMM|nr:type 1 glutamine amidotransferase [Lysobacter silvisoli]RDZ28211.1 gamma-glutamyl-gamma-aminobutyrate hydrolase family protein [Lysobacter silvisoli]